MKLASSTMFNRPAFYIKLLISLIILSVVWQRVRQGDSVDPLLQSKGNSTYSIHEAKLNKEHPPIRNNSLFPVKQLVIWSNDYHIAPIADLKHLLQPLGVKFIDKSLSGHCHITNTCDGRSTLRVINRDNAMSLDPSLIPKFYESYRNDPEMQTVDAFACFLPPAMCELFEPFNRSLLIIVPTRYEAGRLSPEQWTAWNKNLVRMATDRKNLIAANNLYDAEYVRYFTGLKSTVQLVPSYCGYQGEQYHYTATRPGFILAPIHNSGFGGLFDKWYKESRQKLTRKADNDTAELFALRSRYPHYQYSDLVSHRGIVYVPYQVSVMSFFEQYRMNIPLFAPSADLLATWQHEHMVMNERTWDGVFGRRPEKSVIEAHPSQRHLPDPNNEQNRDAIRYWVQFSDFYQVPHVILYNSVDDLVNRLETISQDELNDISRKMAAYNVIAKDKLLETWTQILLNVAKYSPNKPH